jgi:hypothetical protein
MHTMLLDLKYASHLRVAEALQLAAASDGPQGLRDTDDFNC